MGVGEPQSLQAFADRSLRPRVDHRYGSIQMSDGLDREVIEVDVAEHQQRAAARQGRDVDIDWRIEFVRSGFEFTGEDRVQETEDIVSLDGEAGVADLADLHPGTSPRESGSSPRPVRHRIHNTVEIVHIGEKKF